MANEPPSPDGSRRIPLTTRKKLYRTAVRVAQASLRFTKRIYLPTVLVSPWENFASGSFGVVFKGSYCGQSVAFKLLHNQSEHSLRDEGKARVSLLEVLSQGTAHA